MFSSCCYRVCELIKCQLKLKFKGNIKEINDKFYLFLCQLEHVIQPNLFDMCDHFFKLDFSCDPNMQMKETIRLEQDIFVPMAGSGKLYVYHTDRFWSQIKTSGYVITAKWIERVCGEGSRGLF